MSFRFIWRLGFAALLAITRGAAGATDLTLQQVTFPNGTKSK